MAHDGPAALDAVSNATDEASSQAAYSAFLSSVGNNHQGTLYPAAERAIDPLLSIAVAKPGWPAITALNALIDMVGSFEPTQREPEQDAPSPGMKQRMRMAIARRRGELADVAHGDDDFGTAEHARKLLAVLDRGQ